MKIASIVRVPIKPGISERHSHIVWELILTVHGYCTIIVGETPYFCQKGTILCIPPGVPHHNETDCTVLHIGIRIHDFVSPYGSEIRLFQDDSTGTFSTLAEMTFRQFYRSNSEKVVDALCDALCALLFQTAPLSVGNPEIERAKNLFDISFTDPEFSVAKVLRTTHYSDAHFRKLFLEETGMTPVAYLTNLRLNYAKKLLCEEFVPSDSLSDIASYAGFYDQRYFSRLFKRHFGCTPTEFRAAQKVKL